MVENIDLETLFKLDGLNSKEEYQIIDDIDESNLNNKSNSIINFKEHKNKSTKIRFIVKRRRGKEHRCYKNKKYHLANDNDNIRTKIQVHYLNFIVEFFNDIIYGYLGKKNYFLKFAYCMKKRVNYIFFAHLRRLTIKEIFSYFKISNKYQRNTDSYINRKKLEKLLSLNKFASIKCLLDMNYLNFFLIYYNNKKPLRSFKIDEAKIMLKKAKSLYYLNKKYKKYEEELDMIIKMDYLDKIELDNGIEYLVDNSGN